jgi:hypothetical protein
MCKPDLMDEYARRWPSTEFKPENTRCSADLAMAQVSARFHAGRARRIYRETRRL